MYPEGLDIFRKLEARLQLLKSNAKASFGIQSWAPSMTAVPTSQTLWLNFPGKKAPHVNASGAGAVRLSSAVGFASGNEIWIL